MILLDKVHFTYPNGVRALETINLRISRGEVLAILGPNGAGKTTLGKHLNGLLKPTQGEVLVDNHNTKEIPVSELARSVGYVVQNPDHQLFEKTVSREVAFGLFNLGYAPKKIDQRVADILENLGLTDVAERSPLSLSTGQKKRVTIASIVAMDPEFLVLDEPTVAQDAANKEQLRRLLKNLIANSKTVVLITHDIEFALSLADRLILMKDGRILSDAPKNETNLRSAFLEELRLYPPQMVQFSENVQKTIWTDFPTHLYTLEEVQDEIRERL